ncbi:MAG: PA2779 family protein [Tolumonas sp.]
MSAFWGVMARLLIVSLLALSLPAKASMMSAQETMPVHQSSERAHVMQFLAREDVAQQIAAQGVDIALVRQRVAAMSDAEINQLSGKIDQLPAAGSGEIIGAVLFVFIVLLITDILGLTKVFPFTRSVR